MAKSGWLIDFFRPVFLYPLLSIRQQTTAPMYCLVKLVRGLFWDCANSLHDSAMPYKAANPKSLTAAIFTKLSGFVSRLKSSWPSDMANGAYCGYFFAKSCTLGQTTSRLNSLVPIKIPVPKVTVSQT